MELREDERIDDLEFKNLKIIQKKDGFRFGIDSILLSDFAKEIKSESIVADLGTGTGILSILLCAKTKLRKVIGIDIQEEMVNMAQRSCKLNGLQDRFEVINANIKDLQGKLPENVFDAVIMNPPYMKLDTGKMNEVKSILISRHEITASLEDFIIASKKLLKNNGSLFIVHRPNRLIDLCYLLRKYNIEPKILRFVYPKRETQANLVLIKAVKNGGSFLKVIEPLYIYNDKGKYTREILKIYNKE